MLQKPNYIVISCIPKLNESQQTGFLRLIKDFEEKGYQVLFWSGYSYDKFRNYELRLDNRINRFKKKWALLKILLKLDKNKWIKRLAEWLGEANEQKVQSKYHQLVNNALSIFVEFKPKHFFCWNPFCCQYGIAFDIAKIIGIETSGIEWGYLPQTLILDKKGTLSYSEIFSSNPLLGYSNSKVNEFEKLGDIILSDLRQQSLSLYSQTAAEIPDSFKVKINKINILVLAIDEIDAGAFPIDHPDRYGLLPFHTSSYDQATSIAAVNKNYNVIFKPHPSHNKFSNNQKIDDNIWVINGSPDELIDWADIIFCSGSKMEFSALLRKKPLINFGAGLLFRKNCAFEVNHPQELEEVVNMAHKASLDSQLKEFKIFLGYLQKDYLYSLKQQDKENNDLIISRILEP